MTETRQAIIIDITRVSHETSSKVWPETERIEQHEASFVIEPPDWSAASDFVWKLFELLDGNEYTGVPDRDMSGGFRWVHPVYLVTARPSTLMEIPSPPRTGRLSDETLDTLDAGQLREHAAQYAAEHGVDQYVEAIVLALMSLTDMSEGAILVDLAYDVAQIKEGS